MSAKAVLLLEAFNGGSHKQLMDLLVKELSSDVCDFFGMSGKKWHWRSITSALHFAEIIPTDHSYRYMFTSSVLPLADLIALRPDLAKLHKIVYFHENQLIYPVREMKKRYFQHGYNELLTCLSADKVLFNSRYNMESFLSALSTYFNLIPDYRPKDLESKIRPKCSVLYYPLQGLGRTMTNNKTDSDLWNQGAEEDVASLNQLPLHIVWPHRWEHDKNPEEFFSVILRLKDTGCNFLLSVIGETYSEKPGIFQEAHGHLNDRIVHWGYIPTKEKYLDVLDSADVVVSTAKHEFFGVSMLEAVSRGCYPLCPNNLVYPEIYPEDHLYNTANQLLKKLKYFCKKPFVLRAQKIQIDIQKFSWCVLKSSYLELFKIDHKERASSR